MHKICNLVRLAASGCELGRGNGTKYGLTRRSALPGTTGCNLLQLAATGCKWVRETRGARWRAFRAEYTRQARPRSLMRRGTVLKVCSRRVASHNGGVRLRQRLRRTMQWPRYLDYHSYVVIQRRKPGISKVEEGLVDRINKSNRVGS